MRLIGDRRGAVAVLAGVGAMVGIGCLALAVDLGTIFFETRRLQGAADVAALAAVADPSRRDAAAADAAADNGVGDSRIDLVTGTYRSDPSVAPDRRFQPGSAAVDAARVTLHRDVRLYFGLASLGRPTLLVSRSATAAKIDLASFSIGSRLAALDGGLANALLSQLTGSTISLSVADHQALLNAEVDLFAFAEQLRTQMSLEAASFDQILTTQTSAPAVLSALATTINGSQPAAAAIVRRIAAATTVTDSIGLDQLIDLGPLGAQDRVAANRPILVNVQDLVTATLGLANGDRQLRLDLGATIPGIAGTSVLVAIGERAANSPWLTVTRHGQPVIRTAQIRFYIETSIGTGGLISGIANIRLPIYVELAEAEARLTSVSCSRRAGTHQVVLDVHPSIGHAAIADIIPAQLANHAVTVTESSARIIGTRLLAVTGRARADLSSAAWQPVTFATADIDAHRWKTVTASGTTQALAASLANDIQFSVNALGVEINTGPLGRSVSSIVQPVAPAIDLLLSRLTGLLGVHLGQADVRVNGVRCGVPGLVG